MKNNKEVISINSAIYLIEEAIENSISIDKLQKIIGILYPDENLEVNCDEKG